MRSRSSAASSVHRSFIKRLTVFRAAASQGAPRLLHVSALRPVRFATSPFLLRLETIRRSSRNARWLLSPAFRRHARAQRQRAKAWLVDRGRGVLPCRLAPADYYTRERSQSDEQKDPASIQR